MVERNWLKHPAVAYVGPFAVFMALLVIGPRLPIGIWEQPLRVALLAAALWALSRKVIDLRPVAPVASLLLGVAVFAIWVAPDTLWPGYREHWLFQNAITGELKTTIPDAWRTSLIVLVFRTIRAVVLVPIIEELFWRGWLMRWLIRSDFEKVPLGAYAARSFWITALLFASEHGPYWEVGFVAGIAYNWWIIRTKSLGDCILAHAVTNLVLSGYVIFAGKWEYWM
jgi:CAAX prenyl protease-like protein